MCKQVKGLVAAAAVAVLVAAVPPASMHFALNRSAPSAGESVQAPSVITLWFTEVPQDNSISIRLVDARGALVASSDARQAGDDETRFSIRPEATLAPGGYTVAWRGIGQDGHTVRGDFGFTVTAR
jgi:methionine-rich copper-binding protein CopC